MERADPPFEYGVLYAFSGRRACANTGDGPVEPGVVAPGAELMVYCGYGEPGWEDGFGDRRCLLFGGSPNCCGAAGEFAFCGGENVL